MRRVRLPITGALLGLSACNALTGADDLGFCDTCGDVVDPAVDAGKQAPVDGGIRQKDADAVEDASADARDAVSDTARETSTDSGVGCNGAIDCERVVFVTSTESLGALGGVAGADATCQSLANASMATRVQGRTFLAWVSTSTTSPTARMTHGSKSYVRPDGLMIASSWTNLLSGGLINGIALDENGISRTGGAWTATGTSTGDFTGDGCSNWTSASAIFKGTRGNVGGNGGGWSGSAPDNCGATSNHLYCFEK